LSSASIHLASSIEVLVRTAVQAHLLLGRQELRHRWCSRVDVCETLIEAFKEAVDSEYTQEETRVFDLVDKLVTYKTATRRALLKADALARGGFAEEEPTHDRGEHPP
jgi:hypothetical protein